VENSPDLEMPARGVSFQFVRKYRSAQHQEIGALGRGWTFTYTKRIEQDRSDILYHDGFGWMHRFALSSADGSFVSPDGFYALLTAGGDRFLLKQQAGDLFIFEHPDSGGRLLGIEDRNGNALRFEYQDNQILVTDTFERHIEITLEQNRVVELRDHTQRSWQYIYDDNECLIEVIQPPIHGLSDRPRVRYASDQDFRLISITDPKGQTFLRNIYDEQGRIGKQRHGDGTLEFEYEPIDKSNTGFTIFRTRVKLKNGGLLSLKHDLIGHVVERTLYVLASSLSPGDRNGVTESTVPLTTPSNYNRHGELIHRTYPAGNLTEWIYDQDNADPRAQGNLLQVTQFPIRESENDVLPLTTRYTYEPLYQQITSVTNPRRYTTAFEYDSRGNLSKKIYPDVTVQEISSDAYNRGVQQIQLIDRLEYNEAGQLIRFADPRGASIEYFYYPTSDPIGARSPSNSQSIIQAAGGYLARIVRDPASEDRPTTT
jgi:YD repeat-containing protein